MDGTRFDELTRALGSGRSRRALLKTLGASVLGAAGLGRLGSAAAKGSNRACAIFCADVYGAGTYAAFQCTNDAARRQGPCAACGADPSRFCNGACCPVGATCADGLCQCSTDYTLCEGIGGSNCCPSQGVCNGDGSCACLPTRTSCSAYFGTCGYCCGAGYSCNVIANTCQCF